MEIDNLIFETNNFIIVTITQPHVDRKDGGHIIIACKDKKNKELTDLLPIVAVELIQLARTVGAAMKKALNNNGIDVKLINYQINGNWSIKNDERDPMHMHLYGRAKSSACQQFGEALFFPNPNTGFYKDFSGLTIEDIRDIKYILNKSFGL